MRLKLARSSPQSSLASWKSKPLQSTRIILPGGLLLETKNRGSGNDNSANTQYGHVLRLRIALERVCADLFSPERFEARVHRGSSSVFAPRSKLVTRIRERDVDREPSRWGCICFDPSGRALELVAVELADDEVMIIHANYLTAGFEKEMREAR